MTTETTTKPASEAQVEFLRKLGASESEIAKLDRYSARRRIDELVAARDQQPATEKQKAYVSQWLGRETDGLTRGEASALIGKHMQEYGIGKKNKTND